MIEVENPNRVRQKQKKVTQIDTSDKGKILRKIWRKKVIVPTG